MLPSPPLQSRPTGNNYFPFLHGFHAGTCKTRRLDSDANRYFESFLVQFKGKNYIKEAYQKMGWNALIAGDMSRYKFYMERVKLYGDAVIDDDKQALLEAESGIPPNVTLLKPVYFLMVVTTRPPSDNWKDYLPTISNPIKTRLNSPIVLAVSTMRVVTLKKPKGSMLLRSRTVESCHIIMLPRLHYS